MTSTYSKFSISASKANQLIDAAEAKASALGMSIVTTVVDESGVLKAFRRMDGAALIAVDAAQRKARTAVGFGMATGESWHNFIKDDPILSQGVQGLEDFILLGGGVPIVVDGAVVGAIGVSGGHYKQDEACALAALEHL